MKPSNSTLAGLGIGVPLATIIAWILNLQGVEMPGEVQAALGAVISACIGYFFSGGKAGDSPAAATPPALFIALLLCPLMLLAGCAGARSAYKAADTLEEYSYVVTEHYAALLKEAATLRQAGALTGSALAKVQAADTKVAPKIFALKPLVDAYARAKTAETEVALQAAVDDAVRALAELVREIRGARASPTGQRLELPAPRPLYAMVTT